MTVTLALRFFLVALAVVISCGVAFAKDKRVALLIGNSEYSSAPRLLNPANDATDLGRSLERIGFDVTVVLDADFRRMRVALRDFSESANDADIALVYFAGHGIEIDNTNYLIPVNAELRTDRDVEFEALRLDALTRALRGTSGLKLVLVDACRNNPFVSSMERTAATRSIGRGLRRFDPDGGVMVGYAARGGTLALDGDGRNSPYATALLQHIEEPGLELGKMFRKVRDTVQDLTDGYQEPFTYGSLPGKDIFLVPAVASANDVLSEYASAEIENTVETWRAFLDRYGTMDVDRQVLSKARERLAMLTNPVSKSDGTMTVFDVAESTLVRACDRLAADPFDEMRPNDIAPVPDASFNPASAKSACALAVSAHPDHGRSGYQLARALIAGGEEEAGYSLMKEVARSGYIAAEVKAGANLLLHASKDAADDIALGKQLLENAVDGGSARGALELSRYYRTSRGFDRELSKKFLDLAAKRGDPSARFIIGRNALHLKGRDAQSYSLGLEYVSDAAESGIAPARLQLAKHFFKEGIETEQALDYLARAASSGNLPATRLLISSYRFGREGLAPKISGAVPWMKKLALGGETSIWLHLGYIYETGLGQTASPQKAAEFYLNALQGGSPYPLSRVSDDWDMATAMALQRLLRNSSKAGYGGPIDGVVGAGTRAAMQRYCECGPTSSALVFSELFADGPRQTIDLDARSHVGLPEDRTRYDRALWNYKRVYLEAGNYVVRPIEGKHRAWRFNTSAITCDAQGRNCGDDGWNWDLVVVDQNGRLLLQHSAGGQFRTPDMAFGSAALRSRSLVLTRSTVVGFGISDHHYSGGDNSGGVSFVIERVAD